MPSTDSGNALKIATLTLNRIAAEMRKYLLLICLLTCMKCLSQDVYNMQVWKNGNVIFRSQVDSIDSINFTPVHDGRYWEDVMRIPSQEEIDEHNSTSTARSPYVAVWLDTKQEAPFSQISIDFKADHIPPATYCSPVNFYIDYSSLLDKYVKADNGKHISGYGGLQRQADGTRYNAILSLWDAFCTDSLGKTDTLRATLVKPAGEEAVVFNHEGSGVSYRPEYSWMPGKWYRMLVQLGVSETTGNTTLGQWVGDIAEKKWTQLCVFDLGAPGLKFKKDFAAFLENFSPASSGDVRTMELKNVRVYNSTKNEWVNIYSGYMYHDGDQKTKKSGTYQYGTDDSMFWMITTGIEDCAPSQAPGIYNVLESDTGNPLKL